ncbi:MAG: FkbM family methyltransferase [Alphaproteobacteria bacterium]|nr:FkbM family methyltransferase [Alphaproteobacteria bacterium]
MIGRIEVAGLGKAYKRFPNRWARLADWALPGGRARHELDWVLRDVTFSVRPGEAVGIVGLNGAGKSTLLKMIVGATRPTAGTIAARGRIAAVLELGLGFHPDFTGRQNAILAAQLQGFGNEAIARLLPEIEAFAEIGPYFDQPLRIYSTGMQMRLAFAVATAERPDILIIDEALSVGDAYFQHKSFDHIRRLGAEGATLLLVSHDKHAIQSVCRRAILLNGGTVAMEGEPEAVFDYYNALLAEDKAGKIVQRSDQGGKIRTDSGTGEARIESIGLFDAAGRPVSVVAVGQAIEVRFAVGVHADLDGLVLGCGIKDRLGQMMFGTNTFLTGQALDSARLGDQFVFRVRFDANLGEGSYSVHASLVRENSHIEKNYHWVDHGHVFEVVNPTKPSFVGCNWTEMLFDIERISPPAPPPARDDPLVVVDVGCRWGFAERFTGGAFRVFGFDPDHEECERLRARHADAPAGTIHVEAVALARRAGPRRLYMTREPACGSLLEPDPDLTAAYPALDCARHVASLEIEAVTLAGWARDNGIGRIDHIKLDTQGTELEILEGAGDLLAGLRCVEIEVEFNPIYRDQPLFADIDRFLRRRGFVLWKLSNLVHYSRDGAATGALDENAVCYDDAHRFVHPTHGGQLYWADARFIKKDVLAPRPIGDPQRLRDETLFSALGMADVVAHIASHRVSP